MADTANESLPTLRGAFLVVLAISWVLFVLNGIFVVDLPDSTPDVGGAGFFTGLWHGVALFFSMIGQMMGYDVTIYEVANDGALYNAGYVIGIFTVAHSSRPVRKAK